MAYPAASVANAFIERARRSGRTLDPMKLQKLCYLAHGYSLVTREKPLFDEKFEAWKFGPVLPSLYHLLKGYRWRSIVRSLLDYDYEKRKEVEAPPPNDTTVNEIIDFVWQEYGGMDAVDLSDWTHEKGGPWDRVVRSGEEFVKNLDIPDPLIAAYFMQHMNPDAPSTA